MSAISVIEKELVTFFQKREEAVAHLHAVEGAIQGAQHLLAKLKAAEAEAVAATEKAATDVKAETAKVVDAVLSDAKEVADKVVEFAKKI
jgi:cell division septum initiation protein DivIVA